MPTRKTSKKQQTKSKALIKKPRLKPLSLLILECDAEKLKKQSLSVANELNQIIQVLPAKM